MDSDDIGWLVKTATATSMTRRRDTVTCDVH